VPAGGVKILASAGNFETQLEIGGAHDFATVCFDRAALHPGKQPAIAHIVAMREDGAVVDVYP
jgi:hypothetical protein